MPAGSNEQDSVLSYQVGPRLPFLLILCPPSFLSPRAQLCRPLPEGEGRPAWDTRGRSGWLGIAPGCERMTLGRTRELADHCRIPCAASGDLCSPGILPVGREAGFWPRCVLWETGSQRSCSGGAGLFVFISGVSGSSITPRKSWKDWRLGPNPDSVPLFYSLHPIAQTLTDFGYGSRNGLEMCRGVKNKYLFKGMRKLGLSN